MKGIDPKWGAYLGLAVLLEQTIGHGGAALLAGVVPDNWISHITATSNLLAVLGTAVMTWQASVSSSRAGPLADTVISPTIKSAIVLAVLLGALAFPDPTSAQGLPKLRPLTGNIVNDIAAAKGAPTATASPAAGPVDSAVASFSDSVQKIEKQLVDKGIADLQAAITDATNHNDIISLPCWQANLKLLQSLPSQWETPPSPIGIALGIQIQRDILNAITGNDATSLKVACAALWGDQLKIVANVGALIGVRIGTAGLL